MKNFLIALVLAIILVNCLGNVVDDFFGINIVMSDELLSPWENVAVLSVIGVVLAVVGFVVAISVIGTLFIGVGVALLALFVAGVGAFWPIIVVGIVVYTFSRKKQRNNMVYQ